MDKILFVRKVSKIGRYYVITIPKYLAPYIEHGARYVVTLEPLSSKISVRIESKSERSE